MKIKKWLAYYCYEIVKVFFSISFLLFVVFNYFISIKSSILFSYIFCFMTGLYLGCFFYNQSVQILNKKNTESK